MRAIGREFEFMNIEAAIAKLLWERLSRRAQPRRKATPIESIVTITKNIGMTHNSRSFSVASRETLHTRDAEGGKRTRCQEEGDL